MIDRDNAVQSGKTARTVLTSVIVTAPAASCAKNSDTCQQSARPAPALRWPARPALTS